MKWNRRYLQGGETVVHVCIWANFSSENTRLVRSRRLTDSDGVDHDGDFSDAPSHDESADAQVFLERSSESNEAANVQRDGDVTSPAIDVNDRSVTYM